MLLGSRSGLPAIIGLVVGEVVERPALAAGATGVERALTAGGRCWASFLAPPAPKTATGAYKAGFFLILFLLADGTRLRLGIDRPSFNSWAWAPRRGPGRRPRRK